ncbi:unnamed protein product [Durusdinium trenchii]|uniref:Uncharacterized protein n=2 Tax=Durusdinium trenchii TaxID=1381693 RepID=A0ABP0HAU1_9DINO
MGLLGGYDSEEEEEDTTAAPSTSVSAKASAQDAEESSSEEEDEPESKRARLAGPNPLGLLTPKFAKDAGPKATTPAAMAFVPPQVRKKGRVVSTVTDNISDRSFANSKPSKPSG